MGITQHASIRRTLSIGTVAVAAIALVSGSSIAAAAPTNSSPVTGLTSLLDSPAAWAAVKDAALTGFSVPASLAASCGATH